MTQKPLKSLKSTRGGKRPGAGKKKGHVWQSTLDRQAAHAAYRAAVLERMAPIVQAQVEKATGSYAAVAIVEHTDAGLRLRKVATEDELEAVLALGQGYRVVLTEPDMTISKYLTDQVCGKAIETHEVSGLAGGPVITKVVHEHRPAG